MSPRRIQEDPSFPLETCLRLARTHVPMAGTLSETALANVSFAFAPVTPQYTEDTETYLSSNDLVGRVARRRRVHRHDFGWGRLRRLQVVFIRRVSRLGMDGEQSFESGVCVVIIAAARRGAECCGRLVRGLDAVETALRSLSGV